MEVSQVVAGTKTLHHVLPDLIPPTGRQYTFRFFTGQKQTPPGDHRAFPERFPTLAETGRSCRGATETAMNRGGPTASGPAKATDNAITASACQQPPRRSSSVPRRTWLSAAKADDAGGNAGLRSRP